MEHEGWFVNVKETQKIISIISEMLFKWEEELRNA
jgi:hypothetical protein